MSGIAGGFFANKNELDSKLHDAIEKLKHRGNTGAYLKEFLTPFGTLGIALIQLQLNKEEYKEASTQPVENENYELFFTGTIFNYQQLLTQLQSEGVSNGAEITTDAAALLAAWQQWGLSCLTKLKGMFAFALLDKQGNKLTLVRDAFGIAPLYYSVEQKGFAFASEPQAVLPLLNAKPSLNLQAAYDYLAHGSYDANENTFFAGVKRLPSAHYLEVDLTTGQASQPIRWWQPSIVENKNWTFEQATQAVREKFLENIQLSYTEKAAIAAALSGGIDSSAVVCAIRHLYPQAPIKTFSFIAEGSDVNEEEWVDKVNEFTGAQPHKITACAQQLAKDLEAMIQAQGEPFGSTSVYAQYSVFALAKQQGLAITLDGQGADEMLAGYSGYPGQRLKSLIEKGRLFTAWQFLTNWAKWPGRSKSLALKYLAAELTSGKLYEFLRKLDGRATATPSWLNLEELNAKGINIEKPRSKPAQIQAGRRVIAELASALSQNGLNHLLRHGERNAMGFGLQSRVPFLTIDLVELLLSMPEEYLISNQGETKHVFRAAMRGIVPDEVLDRKDKIGFATPEEDWIIELAPQLRSWLAEDTGLTFINQQEMLKEFDAVIAKQKPFSWQIWRWVNFVKWYQMSFR